MQPLLSYLNTGAGHATCEGRVVAIRRRLHQQCEEEGEFGQHQQRHQQPSRVVAADDFSSHLEPSGAAALIDASMLSGTRTGLSGVYRASTRPRESKLMYLERSTQSPSQGAS